MTHLVANPWKESSGTCTCCGNTSKTIWGDLSNQERTLAVYFIQWTVNSPDHHPNIDLIVGEWGEGTDPQQRILVSLEFKPTTDGGSFMVIDAQHRFESKRTICGRGMLRAEVIGTPLASDVFALVDALWLNEPRLSEVKALNEMA